MDHEGCDIHNFYDAPLRYACASDHENIVLWLLAKGANVNANNGYAYEKTSSKKIKMHLIAHGLQISYVNSDDMYLYFECCRVKFQGWLVGTKHDSSSLKRFTEHELFERELLRVIWHFA